MKPADTLAPTITIRPHGLFVTAVLADADGVAGGFRNSRVSAVSAVAL